jgi:CheY-like chemotaxis protein
MSFGLSEATNSQTNSLKGLKILLAEDKSEEAEILTLLLEGAEAQVTRVAYAYQVLEAIRQFRPDVFICDVRLPDMNGDLLIELVRSQIEQPHLPAIAMTTYVRDVSKTRMLQAGFDYFLPKNYDLEELVEAILEVLGDRNNG